MKKEIDVPFPIGKGAGEVMKFLVGKNLSVGEVLDVLSLALIFSAIDANVSKEEFMSNTDEFWDNLKEEMKTNNNFYKTLH